MWISSSPVNRINRYTKYISRAEKTSNVWAKNNKQKNKRDEKNALNLSYRYAGETIYVIIKMENICFKLMKFVV